MTDVVALRPKTYAYLVDGYDDDNYEKNKVTNKRAKGTKMCIIKQKLMFESYKACLFDNKTIYKSQERFKSFYHNMYTECTVVLMIKDYKHLIGLQHIHTEQVQ